MKKRILMIPSWYPTEQNPFAGSFFREQALVLDKEFDFYVLHINSKYVFYISFLFKRFFQKKKINFGKKEFNIEECSINLCIPFFYKVYNFIFDIFNKKKNDPTEGVGKCISSRFIDFKYKQIRNILNNSPNFSYDYVYGVTAQDKAIDAELFAKVKKVPYILSEHAPFPWPGMILSDKQKDSIEHADLFLAISNDKIRQVLLQNIHLSNIQYIGNLVDETMFPFQPAKHEIKTFTIVAANSFYKQYSMLIKIFNELKKITDKNFKLIIAGYNANKGYSKNAESLIEQLNKSSFISNIEFIPSVDRKDLYKLYNRSDAFIMTSIQEGQPVSALEAACCGLPVFSTRCGGVEDYITLENGRLYNITDYKSFANDLNDFLNNKIIFNPQRIREIIISKFGKEAFVNNFTKYIGLLGEKAINN